MSVRRPIPASAGRSTSRATPIAAPILGWVSAQNLAAARQGSAMVLDGWFPTTTGIRMFGGSTKIATLSLTGEPVESLMAYVGNTKQMFGSCAGAIYDITTPADPDLVPTADVTGQTSDYYSTANYATAGGFYMFVVNGDDDPQLYDGTNWYAVNALPLIQLNYDAQTANYTVGQTITGGTSAATGVIEFMVDAGATGTLWVRKASGTFQDNELITTAGGSATANIPGGAVTLAPAITGVTTDKLIQVTTYRNRIWFAEKDTMNAWALPADSIGGAAVQVSLAGIFKNGGQIKFAASWSLDSGDGLDDKIVFVSTEGEVAVYQGSNPADPDNWSLVGLYECPKPLGKNGWTRAGGDLIILTEQGAVPVSQILTKDPSALALSAISRNIQPDWVRDAAQRGTLPWEIVKWPAKAMTLVTNPCVNDGQTHQCYAVNSETGAWCRRRGWDARCLVLHDGNIYFGTPDGRVLLADSGGNDDGANYECNAVLAWDHLKSPGYEKTVLMARARFLAATPFNPQMSASVDYSINLPTGPNVASAVSSTNTWDVGLWDEAIWDDGTVSLPITTEWEGIGISGSVVAMQLQVNNGRTETPNVELVAIDILHEVGEVMV
jgi:hypothetical protein